MIIREIMSTPAVTVHPNASVSDTAKLMETHNIGSVPVTDGTNPVGIITDRDITIRCVAADKNPKDTCVYEIMTRNVATATPDTTVEEALRIMRDARLRRLPITAKGTLVGMVSLGDMAMEDCYSSEASRALSEISLPWKW